MTKTKQSDTTNTDKTTADSDSIGATDRPSFNISKEIIDNASEIAKALDIILPRLRIGEAREKAAKNVFWLVLSVIFAFTFLITFALWTNHDPIVRDLVIALASFLGGFATSRVKST